MASISRRLSGSVEGALAAGGDPATSPLYVFGPPLRLLAAAGVASITFGASIWLAVLTVVTVSAMYRLVMVWVTDGSGGSGLSEEEFGGWAVKMTAGITAIEYTLTFLVSMAAMVTFLADRVSFLDGALLGVPLRTVVASALSLATAFAVNRGPRTAARTFGPATAAVLVLLWTMIAASLWRFGPRLPSLHMAAFDPRHLGFTLDGYARILALMTGIEVFANLVAAYDGPARVRSRKAFGSLLIVMGTTSLTMLIVGPAIADLSNPLDQRVSVFTQAMDALLPAPVAYLGTMVGVAVLLSAAAASAQGIQNLTLGLRYRHYIPAYLGQKNRFDVAHRPVWIETAVCIVCFAAFGTSEETYLALYAAGVFVLLSLTGWAAVRRLARELRKGPLDARAVTFAGVLVAAILTTGATGIIFEDRFREGAWAYFLLVPLFYVGFGWFRRRLGAPSTIQDRLGLLLSSSCLPPQASQSIDGRTPVRRILVPLDGSPTAERATAVAQALARPNGATITLLSVIEPAGPAASDAWSASAREYLDHVADRLRTGGEDVETVLQQGESAVRIADAAMHQGVDVVVMTTHGRSPWQRWLVSSVTSDVIYQTTPPLIVLRPTDDWRSTYTRFATLLVALDGSATAEQVLPFVRQLAGQFDSQVLLMSVPEGSHPDRDAAMLRRYLEAIVAGLGAEHIHARCIVEGSAPAQAILAAAEAEHVDLIMMVSHGRGGVARQQYVKLGSVVDRVLQETTCPVFLVSAQPSDEAPASAS